MKTQSNKQSAVRIGALVFIPANIDAQLVTDLQQIIRKGR
jgi:hypothetical protein